jgi:hypothetical protein
VRTTARGNASTRPPTQPIEGSLCARNWKLSDLREIICDMIGSFNIVAALSLLSMR